MILALFLEKQSHKIKANKYEQRQERKLPPSILRDVFVNFLCKSIHTNSGVRIRVS